MTADSSQPSGDARAIRAEALTKRYGETVAVENLDLWIPRGSVYGFLGPNGAGKTTTMRMLATLTTPTSGEAWVAGEPVSDREAVVDHIGYLPEEPPLHDELTAREQLRYVAGLRDLPAERAARRIDDLLDTFGLAGDADRRISAYSKGMKQKTGIIQAILHEPAVVFLDEPTSGLDPRAARTVRDTVAALADEADTTVFLSTHILPVVDELADTVGVLYDGQLVTEGPPETLKRRAAAGEERTLEDVFIEVTGGDDDHAAVAGERSSDPGEGERTAWRRARERPPDERATDREASAPTDGEPAPSTDGETGAATGDDPETEAGDEATGSAGDEAAEPTGDESEGDPGSGGRSADSS